MFVSGHTTKEITTNLNSCLVDCIKNGCRYATSSTETGVTRCTQYRKPFFSDTPNIDHAYVLDYCRTRENRICLPKVYIDFDDRQVTINHGASFSTSLNDFGSAIQNTGGATGYAVLATYPSDNCVLRPHLCPEGFTLSFYTKLKRITGNGGLITSRTDNHTTDLFGEGIMIYQEGGSRIGFQVLFGPNTYRTIKFDISFPTDWMHIAMTYKHSTETFYVCKDGDRRSETATTHPSLNFVNVGTDFEIVFGRVDTTQDGKHCDCLMDDVQIFEMELDAQEIMELFTYN